MLDVSVSDSGESAWVTDGFIVIVGGMHLCKRLFTVETTPCHCPSKSLLFCMKEKCIFVLGLMQISPPQAYIHTRMRAKTSDFLKVLNRARPDAEKKEMKTIS